MLDEYAGFIKNNLSKQFPKCIKSSDSAVLALLQASFLPLNAHAVVLATLAVWPSSGCPQNELYPFMSAKLAATLFLGDHANHQELAERVGELLGPYLTTRIKWCAVYGESLLASDHRAVPHTWVSTGGRRLAAIG